MREAMRGGEDVFVILAAGRWMGGQASGRVDGGWAASGLGGWVGSKTLLLNQSATFDLKHGAPDRNFSIPLSIFIYQDINAPQLAMTRPSFTPPLAAKEAH